MGSERGKSLKIVKQINYNDILGRVKIQGRNTSVITKSVILILFNFIFSSFKLGEGFCLLQLRVLDLERLLRYIQGGPN